MNFPVNKPEDRHRADHRMEDLYTRCTWQAVRERDSLKESKAEVDKLYLQNRSELIDTEDLLKVFPAKL